MGSGTIRRIAFVATILLLTPVWCRSPAAVMVVDTVGSALANLAPGGGGPVPAIRRQPTGAWTAGARTDQGRTVAALGLLSVLALMALAPWATVRAELASHPSRGRRRHVIALRAPPLGIGY